MFYLKMKKLNALIDDDKEIGTPLEMYIQEEKTAIETFKGFLCKG